MANLVEGEQIDDLTLQVTRPFTYLERLVKWIHVPWWLIWTVLPFVLFLVDNLLTVSALGSHTLWKPLAIWALFSGACSINVVWTSRQLQKSAPALWELVTIPIDGFRCWYEERLQWAFRSRSALAIALTVLFLFSGTALYIVSSFTNGRTALAFTRTALYTITAFGPCCLWPAVIGTFLLGHKLSSLDLKKPIYQGTGTSFCALGTVFFRLTLATIGCYIIVLIALVLSPVAKSPIGLLWSAATGVAILLGFVMPQIGIHRLMVKAKHEKLRIVTRHIETATDNALSEPSAENLGRLKDLYEIQKRLIDMSEWPFNWKALWQLITAVFVPLMLHFVQVVWK
jgi:hypothetical protein